MNESDEDFDICQNRLANGERCGEVYYFEMHRRCPLCHPRKQLRRFALDEALVKIKSSKHSQERQGKKKLRNNYMETDAMVKKSNIQKTVEQFVYQDLQQSPMLRVSTVRNSRGEKFFTYERFKNGSWVSGEAECDFLPYHYSGWKDNTDPIFVVLGEKNVVALEMIGIQATTTPGGSSMWRSSFATYFEGREVIIMPNNNPAGSFYAKSVYEDLQNIASSLRIVEIPGLNNGASIVDFIENGGTKEELLNIRNMFGSSLGNKMADKILQKLQISPKGLTRTQIRDLFQRNKKSWKILKALEELEKHKLAKYIIQRGERTGRWLLL